MNILIIEDEYPAAERLQALLTRVETPTQVIATLDAVSTSCTWLTTHPEPDLILSDIQLSDGLSFEIFERQDVKSPIIFTTAYDEYAIKAFKHNSIDYLVKPIQLSDLDRAIHKYTTLSLRDSPVHAATQISNLLRSLNLPRNQYKERFLVQRKEEWVPVFATEVAFFFSADEVTYLVCSDGRRFVVNYTLTQLEEALDPRSFYRVNRQFIVHAIAVKRVFPYFNGRLLLSLFPDSKKEVIISKSRAGAFKKWFEDE